MSLGSKSSYTDKQKRQEQHIEQSENTEADPKRMLSELDGLPSINKLVVVNKRNLNLGHFYD